MTPVLTPRTGAVTMAWALGVYGALGGLPMQPAHELHLELTQHALGSLTTLWSTHWDLGHSFAGHPPLMHQLISLLARVIGLERAYALSMPLIAAVLTLAMGSFVERLDSVRAGDVAAWLTAANPLVFLFLFPYGQAPFLAAVALALLCAAAWLCVSSGLRGLASGLFFAVASVCTHPAGVVALVVTSLLCLTSAQASARFRIGIVASGLLAAALAAVALSPFLESLHVSAMTPNSKLFAAGSLATGAVWGLVAWSTVISAGLGGRQGRWLALALVWLAAMSVLPKSAGVAADKWLWLAAGFSAVAWGLASGHTPASPFTRRIGPVVIGCLGLGSSYVLGGSSNDGYGHRNTSLKEARMVLEQPGSEAFRYFTLRVGASRFELSRRVRSPSLDSGLPWVAASALQGTGFTTIDELPLGDERGLAALDLVLSKAEPLHLRWVLCADSRATESLQHRGFALRSAWKGDLTLWERPSVTPLDEPVASENAQAWWWAIVPMSSLALGLVLAPRQRHREGAA